MRVGQVGALLSDHVAGHALDFPDHLEFTLDGRDDQVKELANDLPDLAVVLLAQQILDGHAAQVVLGHVLQFTGHAGCIFEPHRVLLRVGIQVGKPIRPTGSIELNAGGLLKCCQGKIHLLSGIDDGAPTFHLHLAEGGQGLGIGHRLFLAIGPFQRLTSPTAHFSMVSICPPGV